MPNVKESESAPPGGWLEWLVTALTVAVIFCRLLTPTEGAPLGDTLWIVQLTLLTLLVWIFAAFRTGTLAYRLDAIDVGVCLLVLGQLVAAAFNWASADRRALCNMVWEWCGLLVTWFLIRRVASQASERRSLVWAVLSLSVALAGLGVWQHYFGLAETRREVARLRSDWAAHRSQDRPSDPREARRWDETEQRLRSEFVRQRIPFEEGTNAAWEQRVNSSTEPFGTFGLANSFAGLLVVALVPWTALLATLIAIQTPRWQLIAVVGACALVAFCLLLTKSRTAYVALAVGMVVALAGWHGARLSSRKIWFFVGAVVGVAILAGVAVLTGAVDREVVSESFKSLRYRGEYWAGSWRMMTDDSFRWLTGVGPGNFRANYLRYKLPESSEEIADPHNLLLDVWANGGLLAAAGLLVLLIAGLLPLARNCQPPLPPPPPETKRRKQPSVSASVSPWRDPASAGAALAFGSVYLSVYLLGGGFDERMIPLLFGSVVAAAIALPLRQCDLPASVYAATLLALAVHLLGAGGIAMPAITQTLLLLVAIGTAGCGLPAWTFAAMSVPATFATGAAALALYLGCWFKATTPVMNSRADRAVGEQAWLEEGRDDKAERAFKRAAEADPFDSGACEWLASLYLQRWLRTNDAESALFDSTVYWQRQAILRQPLNYGGYRTLGAIYLKRFDRTRETEDAVLAADEFAQAIALYPHHAELQSEMAEAMWRADQPEAARSFAERATELDALNRRLGHLDKVLSESRTVIVGKILKTQPAPPEQVDDFDGT